MRMVRLLVCLSVGLLLAVLAVVVCAVLEFGNTPSSEFSRKHAEEVHRRGEEEKKQLETSAQKVAQEMAEERGFVKSGENAQERKKKIEMLKLQYEAALLVGAPNSTNMAHVASDLGADAKERTQIIDEFREIYRRVRAIRDSLDWEKQRELEKQLERLRKGESGEEALIRPPAPDFKDIFGKFFGSITDEDRLRWACVLKTMKLADEEVCGLCAYYDSLADVKIKYVVADILCGMSSPAATAKLLAILTSETDWPLKQMICYSLEKPTAQLSLQPSERNELVRLYDQEPSHLVRERLVRIIGLQAAAEHADKLLDIAKTDSAEEVRTAVMEFLDASRPEHRGHLLEVVRGHASYVETRGAWMALWNALDPQFPTNAELAAAGRNDAATDDVLIRLRHREKPDEDVYNTLLSTLRGELGNSDVRCWLLEEYLALWPSFWPDYPLNDTIRQIAANDPDEGVRERASFLLQLYEHSQEK